MSDDLSGDMLAPSWPNLVSHCNYFDPDVFHHVSFSLNLILKQIQIKLVQDKFRHLVKIHLVDVF